MTRLVILADTHMPRRGKELPGVVLDALQGADLIVHLGDFTNPELVVTLEEFGPLKAVHGNNDSAEVRRMFPGKLRFDVDGRTVALVHGDIGAPTALEAARREQNADLVLFGHSHRPVVLEENGRMLLNPGSAMDRRWAPTKAFAIADIDESIVARIIPLP
ncbi:MAG: metallophosphoesterase family protein [Chloroflexota bacterium]